MKLNLNSIRETTQNCCEAVDEKGQSDKLNYQKIRLMNGIGVAAVFEFECVKNYNREACAFWLKSDKFLFN